MGAHSEASSNRLSQPASAAAAHSSAGSAEVRELPGLIACPTCDMIHRAEPPRSGEVARCSRCNHVLIAPRPGSIDRVLAYSLASAVLMIAAIYFPFLELSTAGLEQRMSIIDAISAFSTGLMLPLSIATAMLIVVIPILRALLLSYALAPLRRGRPPFRRAAEAFRVAETLRPWSMAEVFIIGTAVALVKIAGMATVGIGPAFWAFAAMAVILALKDGFMCRWTIWQMLDPRRG
ncbi:paraquat-inducible protein A [Oceanomicrobium pacificus]|uniref:Paraquat-inducible protein A n=1 Tax=Oceanomicrobium pacificus TaxID=2692916 RepID=A0A6B0TTI4_9RHOB|nr:paraquat-inducible protein A [Oceanomicrobium pacificus]MXU66089.1 paraquat-inducible protein A [Oceanomicrobium pacificus]